MIGSPLPPHVIKEAVSRALSEDLGRAGDITSHAILEPDTYFQAAIRSRQTGIVCGTQFVIEACRQIDPDCVVDVELSDGDTVNAGQTIATLKGPAIGILTAERSALNFLGHLSGIATATRLFHGKIAHTKAKICCTRKTTPGLRAVEKYAVRCGGGSNHRFGLDDAVLIKDNHIAAAGSLQNAIEKARANVGHLVKIEVETDTLDQVAQALNANPDVIMLDNMNLADLGKAVDLIDGRAIVEASGNITLATVQEVAQLGVDRISSGWITHSCPVLDVGLDVIYE